VTKPLCRGAVDSKIILYEFAFDNTQADEEDGSIYLLSTWSAQNLMEMGISGEYFVYSF
jgi:hypothetical protein